MFFKDLKKDPQKIRLKASCTNLNANPVHLHKLVRQNGHGTPDGFEHKPEVRKRNESAIQDHAEITGYDVTSTDVEVLERGVTNYRKRIFLEASHSVLDEESVNDMFEEVDRPG